MIQVVTKAEFARIIGKDRSWVTRMAQQGRLAMEGDRVKVEESRALLEQTRGTRDDVADRHAENRSHQRFQPDARAQDQDASMESARRVKAVSEARRVRAIADQEEMTRDRLAGSLLAREDVDAAFKSIGALVRAEVVKLADRLAPIVTPMQTQADVHAEIDAEGRNMLENIVAATHKQIEAVKGDFDAGKT